MGGSKAEEWMGSGDFGGEVDLALLKNRERDLFGGGCCGRRGSAGMGSTRGRPWGKRQFLGN